MTYTRKEDKMLFNTTLYLQVEVYKKNKQYTTINIYTQYQTQKKSKTGLLLHHRYLISDLGTTSHFLTS